MSLALTCSLMGPLASACVFDLRERRIPNKLVLLMAVLWCIISFAVRAPLIEGLMGATVLGGGAILLAYAFERLTNRTAIGGGDIKLLAVIGLYLGTYGGLICLLGACVAAVMLAVIVSRTRFAHVPGSVPGQIPFAPALFAGAALCLAI